MTEKELRPGVGGQAKLTLSVSATSKALPSTLGGFKLVSGCTLTLSGQSRKGLVALINRHSHYTNIPQQCIAVLNKPSLTTTRVYSKKLVGTHQLSVAQSLLNIRIMMLKVFLST